MSGTVDLLNRMGLSWSKQFEVEVFHAAIFLLKDSPDEIARANEETMKFFLQVSWMFFGGPTAWKGDMKPLIHDVLSPSLREHPTPPNQSKDASPVNLSSLTLIVWEVASTKPLVR